MPSATDLLWMKKAIALAKKAAENNEVPVGAVLVRGESLLGEGCNQPIGGCDPTGHAEIIALRAAAAAEKNYRLPDTTLYVTIEPCTMCLGAIIHARVGRVVFGATEPKAGVLASNPVLENANFYNHKLAWEGGVCEQECSVLISDFFTLRREGRKALKRKDEK
ncbi:tRNA adenosine(34) deaminase TadA [Teredinibacter haidensis]|uniref:tRNA adenosine(34) deaminase TadA n=1 Tax=Teredinibacter haidensis TaxID=2731755 RepID=UPI000948FFCC|nr:tRNA adenosine(34) deaminase TadA [Teredinibacter haidensis]